MEPPAARPIAKVLRPALALLSILGAPACAHLAPWPSASVLPRSVREDPRFPDTVISVDRRRICGHPLTFNRMRSARMQLIPREKPAFYQGRVVRCERGMLPRWRCSEPTPANFIHDARNGAEIEVSGDLEPEEAAAAVARALEALEQGTVFPRELARRPAAPVTLIQRFETDNPLFEREQITDCAYEITLGSFGPPGHATLCVTSASASGEVRWIWPALTICLPIDCQFLD